MSVHRIKGFIIIGILTLNSCGENKLYTLAKVNDNAQSKATIINGPMSIGISYYPERRTPSQWISDYKLITEAGIKRIRIAEFAWSSIEPNENQINWEWLDKAIALAGDFGLEVVLCTPTAAPPVWLVEKYPEVLPVDDEGRRTVFGARQHRCYNSPKYTEHSQIIVTKMAERYGKNPLIVAWQLDNEFGGEQKRCYCDNCRKEFIQFLKTRYTSIEELNKRWGNAFWSMDYQSFDQIQPPLKYTATLSLKRHPSLEMEYSRFASTGIVKYSNSQLEIIKKYSDKPVTTNRFAYNWGDNLNSFDLNERLDAAAFDLYSDKPHEIAFYADFNRSLNAEHSWVLEYSTRSENLAQEMQLLHSRGISWLYFFKLNPFPHGQEQALSSLLTITNKPAENYYVVKNWTSRDLNKVEMNMPYIGLVYDFESSWAYFFSVWGEYTGRLIYQDYVINTVYQALFQEDNPIEILRPDDINLNLNYLILPHQIIYHPKEEQLLFKFLENGGNIISTSDLFQKNKDNVFMNSLPKLYTDVLNIQDNFVECTKYDDLIIAEVKYKGGLFIMINQHACLDQWKQVLSSYINGYNKDWGSFK